MHYQEAARRLEQISDGFEDATTSLAQIFRDLKLTSEVQVPEGAPHSQKFAASAAVVSDMERLMQEAANPESVAVAVQLGKVGDKIRIALPGGAVLSEQELAWINDPANSGKPAPGNLFYLLAQDQLVRSGELAFTYDLGLASAKFTDSLRANLKRELGEEMGADAAAKVAFGAFLDGERTTTLTSLKLPDAALSREIAIKLAERGVTIDDKDTLKGIYTTVSERVAVAHGPLSIVEALSTDNEEAKGIKVKTLGELLDLARRTAESADSYRNFKAHHTDRHGSDGIRNPSTTWGLGQLVNWLKDKVVAADTYKEGPRSI